MKKVLLASFLLIGASATIFSCNNGAYDANPETDLSSTLNPSSPDSAGVKVYLGSMEGRINGKKLIFTPAFYYIDGNGGTRIVARVKDDSVLERTLRIDFSADVEIDTYKVNADGTNPNVTFTMIDTNRLDKAGRKVTLTYTANTKKGVGFSEVIFNGKEGGHLRGKYNGNLFRVAPEEMLKDEINFTSTEFYFRKEAYPLKNGLLP